MDTDAGFLVQIGARSGDAYLPEINDRLAVGELSITQDEIKMLSERRKESLIETERLEFGKPAIIDIAEAIAMFPCITNENVADILAELQSAFYTLRDELPIDIPDTEIIEALCACYNAREDASEVTQIPADEMMAFSDEYMLVKQGESLNEYRLVDDEGRTYSFDPTEWDYDEHADGWEGESWSDEWDD